MQIPTLQHLVDAGAPQAQIHEVLQVHVCLLRQLKLDSVVWIQRILRKLLLREDLQGCCGRVLLELESLAQIWLVARKQLFNPGSAQVPAQQGILNRVNGTPGSRLQGLVSCSATAAVLAIDVLFSLQILGFSA